MPRARTDQPVVAEGFVAGAGPDEEDTAGFMRGRNGSGPLQPGVRQ